jgi:hypothetical protein
MAQAAGWFIGHGVHGSSPGVFETSAGFTVQMTVADGI